MSNTGNLTLPSLTTTLALLRAAQENPAIRCQIGVRGLQLSAATATHLVSVHRRDITSATSATTIIDLEQAAGSLQIVHGKWVVNGKPAERRRARVRLRPTPLPSSVRACRTSTRTLRDLVGTYLAAPHTTSAVFDASGNTLRVAADGDVVRVVAAVASTPLDGEAPVSASMPLTLAHAALAALPADSDVDVTIGDGVTEFSTDTVAVRVESLTDNTSAALPVVPQPNRRRHDVSVAVEPWREFSARVHKPFLDTVPSCHLRVHTDGEQQTLAVDVRSAGHAYHAELPCSTSDSFAIDVPWQSLLATLAPAITAGADTVTLRAFDQAPTLTPLVATFTSPSISGFAATVARGPLLMAA